MVPPGQGRAPAVTVVMATFNGERFLKAQLDSLAAQTVLPARLVVADDGSTDGTLALLAGFVARAPFPVEVLAAGERPLKACANFGRALAHAHRSGAEAVALCDQDDLWAPRKLEVCSAVLSSFDASRPLALVHDLNLVDDEGRPCAQSFWRHQGFDPESGRRFRTLLAMCSFPGCGMVVNRALLDVALPVPPQAVMHDWWLVLVAAAVGEVVALREALVDYRQHRGNVVGARTRSWWRHSLVMVLRGGPANTRQVMEGAARQAEALVGQCGERMPGDERRTASAFGDLPRLGRVRRRVLLLRTGVRKTGWLRYLNMLLNA